jgi:DNA polymerase-1
VHDELVLEVPKNEQDDARQLVVETMQTAMELDCPIRVEAGFGENWLVAH